MLRTLSRRAPTAWRPLCLSLSLLASCAARPPRPAPGPAGAAEPTALSDAQRRRDAAAAPRIRALLAAHANFGGALSPDGRLLLFRSDRGGTSELYLAEVARPEAPPKKLVGGPERVASAVFTPDGRSVLFRQDTGADENFHILTVPVDGGAPTDLTPGEPLWRDSPIVPRRAPGVMVFSARQRTDYTSMLFVQALPAGAPRRVFVDAAPGTVVDVSPDGAHALWVREARAGGHEALEIDLAAGSSRLLRAGATAAAYSADGEQIYVATESDDETHALLALDRASLAPRGRYLQPSPATASIFAVVPSPRGDVVAVGVDAGNRSVVRLLDARTLALVREVATPLGVATVGAGSEVRFALGGGTFRDDGSHFVLGLSTPEAPDDLFLVDAATGALAPLRREPRPELAGLPPIVASVAEVEAFDGRKIPVNVYLPKGRTERRPTLVYFHGGPEASTALEWNAWARVFLDAGFAVIEPNIRGSTGFGHGYERADDKEKRADAMNDVARVNLWARQQPWCDPARLVIEGASFGGYLVLMGLTRQPELWAAGVDIAGPSDLMALLRSGSSPARYVTEFGEPDQDAALIKAFSPIHDVAKIRAPLFVYQGQNDARVPREHADAVVRAARARGVPVEYMVPPDEGHTVTRRENQIELLARVIRFLRDELRAPPRP